MRHTHTARLAGLGIADAPGSFLTRPVQELLLTLAGIEGDRHHGLTRKAGPRDREHPRGTELKNARQLSLVSVEEVAAIADALKLQALDWGKLGANLVLSGVAGLTRLPPSSRLIFPSGATVVIDSENAPCSKPARELNAPDFVKAALHRRGLVGWVERAGVVRVDELITVWEVLK
jgi:MOSC domain-containing protein YiiM